MRNEAFDILKDISKWKLIFWLLLAITLTPITELIIYRLVTSNREFAYVKRTWQKFIRIFGYEKYKGIKESLWMMIVSYLFLFSIFSSYLYIFIVMKESFTMKLVLKMIEEICYIANGNFNHKVSIVNHNYLEG